MPDPEISPLTYLRVKKGQVEGNAYFSFIRVTLSAEPRIRNAIREVPEGMEFTLVIDGDKVDSIILEEP